MRGGSLDGICSILFAISPMPSCNTNRPGGWGAAGGSAESAGIEFGVAAPIRGGILGAAGGKAVQTNGHAVTWLSGANRAYGAIG